jgi:NTE family protein
MSKKLGFALGAGGSRGVAHAGFLKAMEEEGIFPDYISGCSMGSVVGSCYALGMKPDEIIKEINRLKFSDIFDLSLNPLGKGALLRSKKVYKKMQTYLKDVTFSQLKTPFTCVATDLISGQTKTLGGDTKLVDAVVASSAIPGVFRATNIDNMSLVDGGLKCRVPIEQVRDMGAEVVVAVDVLGNVRECDKKYNMFSVLFRMFDIMDADITYKRVSLFNPDLYIEPDLGDMVQYKFKGIENAIEIGYQTGKEYAEKIKELIK